MLSDEGSIPSTSTKWTLHEHFLLHRRICGNGVVVRSKESRGSQIFVWLPRFRSLVCFLLFYLPLLKFLLPLFTIIVFPYLRNKETSKGFIAYFSFDKDGRLAAFSLSVYDIKEEIIINDPVLSWQDAFEGWYSELSSEDYASDYFA